MYVTMAYRIQLSVIETQFSDQSFGLHFATPKNQVKIIYRFSFADW